MKSKFWIIFTLMGILFTSGLVLAVSEGDRSSMPDSHKSGWLQGHQTQAKINQSECQMCHKPMFCVDCHQRRDSITERVHKRNWKFTHSIEARMNPRKCDSCHKPVFCTTCHQNPR